MWWIWAALLASSLLLSPSTQVSLTLILVSLALVIVFRSNATGKRTFIWVLRLATFAFCIRMIMALLLGVPMPGTALVTLPQLQLPEFLVGIRLGGPVTTQRLASAFSEAIMLVALILVFATANTLSNPHSLLRILPQRFYGLGLASAIASSVAPQAARSIDRVKNARRLRGHDVHVLRSWRGVALPVLEDSLERSIDLAASLESRGYGYFPQPTRYRPENWGLRENLAISGPLFVLLLLIYVSNIGALLIAILFLAMLTPVWAS